jgi:tetratricopeptide (TPR) repeat protein
VLPVVIIIAIVITAAVVGLVLYLRKSGGSSNGKKQKTLHRDAIIREANKRLAQNPKDTEALLSLADLLYGEEDYEKAFRSFAVLIDLCASNSELDEFSITLKYGISAIKQKKYKEGYKALVYARTLKKDVFELNHHLGYLEYLRKNYDKAIQFLRLALEKVPDHGDTIRYLGFALFRTKRFKNAISILKKVIDLQPDDKEALFALAKSYFELNVNEQAIKIFSHLRPDPTYGAVSALFSGTIHMNARQYEKAIMDFEIGLRHVEIKQDVSLELKYRLSNCYSMEQDISKALPLLTQIQKQSPNYKDVPAQIGRFQELNSNQNLQIYLLSPPSEFVTLCRKICTNFFHDSKTKITSISVQKNEYADLLCSIETGKWQDDVLFRYIRSAGQIGELLLRDMHSKIKELKAGRGFCIVAGSFTESSKYFVEARLIDLIEKEELLKILNRIDSSVLV